jgi:hypothetical protein
MGCSCGCCTPFPTVASARRAAVGGFPIALDSDSLILRPPMSMQLTKCQQDWRAPAMSRTTARVLQSTE